MRYARLKTTDPYLNLAIEEYLFRYSDDDIFMLWQNRPSVIVGKNQNVYAEVDLPYTQSKGISVVRRITGGGAVYHDGGNVNYSFITSREKADSLDFARFAAPIIEALGALGLNAALSGRNDILCEGKKISGNAQFSDGRRILHHGTLLFDADLDEMSAVLNTDTEKLKARAIRSHKGRVVNLRELLGGGMSVEDFILHLERQISSGIDGTLTVPDDDARLSELFDRNRSEEWIFSHKTYLREYTVRREKRFGFGTVAVELSLNGDRIEKAAVSGDFFENSPVSEFEALMVGKTIPEIRWLDPSGYVHGMKKSDLGLLFEKE